MDTVTHTTETTDPPITLPHTITPTPPAPTTPTTRRITDPQTINPTICPTTHITCPTRQPNQTPLFFNHKITKESRSCGVVELAKAGECDETIHD